ncbi:MAG: hypothetical protein A2802_02600 [Candidatus Woykebacteria bacterium RIFCSPHIGHO2_01_FULL_43_29]|uniref:Ceramidase n=2 Tax=Candidatus Woykeibacteriota TaxID=1817899 RepID=A0A1G1WVP9_9BACT|nr:MAG: hypothetical protein A2802_02600 [Candidatus Woykebacteria bacterium RIFCSPHIGHO2_01_FULL_43_29]OGY29748.1 MAG: hypothetical protein A3J50_00815 [Candidatus Woykebacteria bacterium RIFCSPHIGHO2_02_FULL_43_16b]OGY31774.1 MAG: hypothetical protein A3A61_02125 [Candidatus Woykebacteria bacterium RIFCSPLOWO2_01_FULL_43_14]
MNFWQSYLNLYASLPDRCEKAWGLISEPVDTVSNIAFFIATYLIYRLYKKYNLSGFRFNLLIILVMLIGLGSTVYHAFNNVYTALFDLLPIYFFVFYSLYSFTSFLSKSTAIRIGTPLTLFIIQIGFRAMELPLFIFGMPTFHLFNILFILALSSWAYRRVGKMVNGIFPIVISYSLGILMRYFDLTICPINGVGTHFLWHISVAFATYYTARFFVTLSKNKVYL